MTKESFLKGAAILGIAGLLVKVIGAIYRIPLGNIIGPDGLGYYQTAYPLYTLLLTISTSGVPIAIAKLVSEKRALGDHRGAHKIFKVSIAGSLLVGIITSLFIAFNAEFLVKLLGNEGAYYSLIALVPALFFVPILSAFRGYFQGRQNMTPTALSQIIEQIIRVTVGFTLTYLLLDKGIPIAAGGAQFGGSAGAIAGTIIIFVVYLMSKKKITHEIERGAEYKTESVYTIVKNILSIAIPIMIGAAIVPIMDSIDTAIVLRRLQTINFTQAEANDLFGQLKGFSQSFINLPQVLSLALAVSLVPAISDAFTRKDYDGIKKITRSGVRVTLLIGLPSALGLFILSTPIMELLYFNNDAETLKSSGEILQVLSFTVIFLTLVQSLTAILQGLGKPFIPVRNLAIGALLKLVITYTLTGIPAINIKGAAIGTVIAFLVASVLNFIAVIKHTKTEFSFTGIFVKPIISTALMTISAWGTYHYLSPHLGGKLTTVLAIMIAAVVYGLALLLTGAITSRDFELLPGGKKIASILKATGLLRI